MQNNVLYCSVRERRYRKLGGFKVYKCSNTTQLGFRVRGSGVRVKHLGLNA